MIYDKKSFQTGNTNDPDFNQKIIDALPVPIFYRDLNGIYQMCNKAHEKFTGRLREQIIGKSVFEIHNKELADIYSGRDKELLANPNEQVYETQMIHSDGTTHNVIFNKAVIRNNDDKIIGIVGSINDITELKKTEKRLESAQKSMEVSSHMLHKISAGIIIMDDKFKVVDSNESFAKLMGEEIIELYKTIPGLRGADVKVMVPEVIFKMLASIMSSGEELLERDLKIQNNLLHVSVITLYKQRVVGAVIRDMSAPMLVRDEIINRAQRINKQSIETVQKIAFLLGDNAAETEELLNSIIQSYRYGDDE
ncbi:MAG: PAS domain S-box protein [Prolixibacteraceae bacterium]|jgi:PAS domain S-box-containing protein|nr:PAS domain S-box protein [Prolixibacteraceae bacterium]MBT6766260.1 PAS domain S-box protein [Prolixibacteraceae bacterium]MBT6998787.1 PAS domain S-box protein [Prolixibacteraceae bacterium]MBT7396522.1 PAS domain S-box protein [Prolixibacteraceae bacterium]